MFNAYVFTGDTNTNPNALELIGEFAAKADAENALRKHAQRNGVKAGDPMGQIQDGPDGEVWNF